jgi:glycosyltransferase involved in cell wall biosynthesis
VKATVLLVTYNHSAYIRQAVESVLAQEADFEWELLITEDCSTDGTREIVQEYAERYPERIRLLLSKLNQNDNEVVSRGIDAARGTYLALLDGDDYWLGPRKLELQAERMDAESGCTLCFHDVLRVDAAGNALGRQYGARLPPPVTVADVVAFGGEGGLVIPTASVMLRRSAVVDLPASYRWLRCGDWPLFAWVLERGSAAYLDVVLSAYRIHPHGAWSGRDGIVRYQEVLAYLGELDDVLGGRHSAATAEGKRLASIHLAGMCERAGDVERGRAYLADALGDRSLVSALLYHRTRRIVLLLYVRPMRWLALLQRRWARLVDSRRQA